MSRVVGVVSDIVVHHDDDPLIGNSIPPQNVISVTNVRLMTIIVVTVGARDQHGPMFRFTGHERRGKNIQGEEEENSQIHCLQLR